MALEALVLVQRVPVVYQMWHQQVPADGTLQILWTCIHVQALVGRYLPRTKHNNAGIFYNSHEMPLHRYLNSLHVYLGKMQWTYWPPDTAHVPFYIIVLLASWPQLSKWCHSFNCNISRQLGYAPRYCSHIMIRLSRQKF